MKTFDIDIEFCGLSFNVIGTVSSADEIEVSQIVCLGISNRKEVEYAMEDAIREALDAQREAFIDSTADNYLDELKIQEKANYEHL